MPLDSVQSGFSKKFFENTYLNRSEWKLKYSFWFRRCYFSKKQLFGKLAYRGQYMLTGPGDPIIYEYWISKEEFIMWKLTQ